MKKIDRLKVIEYQDNFKEKLYELSVEWLNKYVSIEPEDIKILNNPKEVIIDKGGHIYFATLENEIVGTVSLIKKSEKIYKLAKLAVTEKAKGMGIGKMLMDKCITISMGKGIDKLILYTNKKLYPAISLYKKYNFQEIKLKKTNTLKQTCIWN